MERPFKPNPKPEPREKKVYKGISRISASEKTRKNAYMKIRKIFLKENPTCERCLSNPSIQVHHQKGRLGELLIDVAYFMAVCDTCHRHIEMNPLESLKMGYSFKRL